jgi:hypothetical protein
MGTIEFRTTVKNGEIEIPAKYRNQIKNRVRVVLFSESEKPGKNNLIDQLLENPVKIQGLRPMKRDKLHER